MVQWIIVYQKEGTSYYVIKVKLFNDMTNLGHVYVIKSKDREELINLENKEKMNSALLVNIFRFIMLLAIQIVIFNNMNFLGYISPFPYILYIILYPVNSNRSGLIISSFLLGLTMDMFCNSGGDSCNGMCYSRLLQALYF